jgi:hypothetical protein
MDDLSSEAIKIYQRGWCSHVDVVLIDGLLGAREAGGVAIRPFDYEKFSRIETVTLNANSGQSEVFEKFLKDQIGKPYDNLAIVAFALERNWRSPNSWFCSELVTAALEECLWFSSPISNSFNTITPRDLLLIVSGWAAPQAP